jgi:hypothetical protein
MLEPTPSTSVPAPSSAGLPRRPQLGASSGWIVAVGACIAVAVLCHTVNHYRSMLTTMTARMHLLPVHNGQLEPDSPSGATRLVDEAMAAAR